jgi:hypothetical protein
MQIFKHHPDVLADRESHSGDVIMQPLYRQNLRARLTRLHDWRQSALERYDKRVAQMEGRSKNRQTGLLLYVERDELERCILKSSRMLWLSQVHRGVRVVRWIFDRWFEENGGKPGQLFVEKTPRNVFYIKDYLRYMPEAKAIEIVRDPRNVYLSLERLGQREAWARGTPSEQLHLWLSSIEAGARAAEEFPDRIQRVRYEDLRTNLRDELTTLFKFAGLSTSESLLDHIEEATKLPTQAKGPFFGEGAVGATSWKDKISKEVLDLFDEGASDWLDRYDYPRSDGRSSPD